MGAAGAEPYQAPCIGKKEPSNSSFYNLLLPTKPCALPTVKLCTSQLEPRVLHWRVHSHAGCLMLCFSVQAFP